MWRKVSETAGREEFMDIAMSTDVAEAMDVTWLIAASGRVKPILDDF